MQFLTSALNCRGVGWPPWLGLPEPLAGRETFVVGPQTGTIWTLLKITRACIIQWSPVIWALRWTNTKASITSLICKMSAQFKWNWNKTVSKPFRFSFIPVARTVLPVNPSLPISLSGSAPAVDVVGGASLAQVAARDVRRRSPPEKSRFTDRSSAMTELQPRRARRAGPGKTGPERAGLGRTGPGRAGPHGRRAKWTCVWWVCVWSSSFESSLWSSAQTPIDHPTDQPSYMSINSTASLRASWARTAKPRSTPPTSVTHFRVDSLPRITAQFDNGSVSLFLPV